MSHLSRVVEDDDNDPPPTPRSHEEMLRVITNIICVRPGEILLLLNSSVRKALLEELVVKKKALYETESPRFFTEDSLTRFVNDNTEAFSILIKKMAIVSFPTPGHKNNLEKRISNCRREDPAFKLSCSRPKLGLNKSEHFESEEDMKAQIKLHHVGMLKGTTNAHKDNQVNGIQMNLKQLKGPNRSYCEFMDPLNGPKTHLHTMTSPNPSLTQL